MIRGRNEIASSAPIGLLSSVTISETPEELAVKSIKQLCNGPAYNRSKDTNQDIIKAQLMNFPFRLSYLAAHENLSEELKICLALKLIEQEPNKLYWAPTQHVLALRLHQIQNSKKRPDLSAK